MKVLYVEDSADDAALVRRSLTRNAPQVHLETVSTLSDARRQLATPGAWDLVIVDLALPDGDGLDLIIDVRRRALPVAAVVLTGDPAPEVAVAALKAGADDYIVKQGDYRDRLPTVLTAALARFRDLAGRSRAVRVLYAEDEPDHVALTRRHFNRHASRLSLDIVDSIPDLMARLSSHPGDGAAYDVVVLDYCLRGETGLTGLKMLRDELRTEIPVIVVSGNADGEVTAAAFRLGAVDFIVKQPGYLFRLTSAIENACYRTEIRQEHEALQNSERLFSDLFEFAPDAMVITDARGTMIMVNGRAEELFGWSRQELTGSSVEILVPRGRVGDHVAAREGYVRGTGYARVMGRGRELRAVRKDGREIPVEISLSPLTLAGRPAFAAAIRDITERKELQARFLQAQKMETLGRLVGGIAHDFNNMLTVINGTAEMAAARTGGHEALSRDVAVIAKAGEKAAALTRQLLAFSRKQVLQPVVVDAAAVMSGMASMLQRVVGDAIEVVVRTGPEPSFVRVDAGQFEQVVMNLVVNARDAMPDGGRLAIEVGNTRPGAGSSAAEQAASASHVLIAVIDTGVGIDEAIRPHIFEPFFTTKAHGRGTGLGLSTVHGIVKQSGGDIEVTSVPGQGSTFSVYLPWTPPAGARQAQSVPATPRTSRGGETILVVDDDEGVRRLEAQMLTACGYTVLEAASGAEALGILARHAGRIHLLVTDVVMPGMSGLVLWKAFAVRQPEGRVLFASGYADDAALRSGVLSDGVPFIEKPFTGEGLTGKVRSVLDAPIRSVPAFVPWPDPPAAGGAE